MKQLIAKRYVKALLQAFSQEELSGFLEILRKIEFAFTNESFKDFISSPHVLHSRKTALVLEIVGEDNTKFSNFIKILGEKNRFEIVPAILHELEKRISVMNSSYVAILSTQEAFSEEVLKSIESTFAKKLNVSLELSQKISQKDGVKLVVDDLGVEVSFSKERFIDEMRSHILRAF